MRVKVGCDFRKPVNFKTGYWVDAYFGGSANPFLSKFDVDVSVHDLDKDLPKWSVMDRNKFKETFKITGLRTYHGYPWQKGKSNARYFYFRLWIDNNILLPTLKFFIWLF